MIEPIVVLVEYVSKRTNETLIDITASLSRSFSLVRYYLGNDYWSDESNRLKAFGVLSAWLLLTGICCAISPVMNSFIYIIDLRLAGVALIGAGIIGIIAYFTLESFRAQWIAKNNIDSDLKNPSEKSGNGTKNYPEIFGYVSSDRIQELKTIKSNKVDLGKLIRLCEELNIAYDSDLNFSTAMLLRSVLDHVPPIFGKDTFKEVASEYGRKSFKDTMEQLEKSARKIADSHLHGPIRRKEALPTSQQVNFSQNLDVLLGEVICILHTEAT